MKNSEQILKILWEQHKQNTDALENLKLTGDEPVFPSSFAVGTAAQVSMACAALMATELGRYRGLAEQTVTVDMLQAAIECTGCFTVNGKSTPKFAELSGLYRCNDGWIRLHANFEHHRNAALQTLGLPPNANTDRSLVESQTLLWPGTQLETTVLANGGACAAVRSFNTWDQLPQAKAIAQLPLVEITKLGEAAPKNIKPLDARQRPLAGIRILDFTRILAGPVCGRTLAAYGANVMLINSPKLPNIDNIIETSRGKLSALLDLEKTSDNIKLQRLLSESHVFIQGYRPGALAAKGLDPNTLAQKYPGIICTSLSAYGRSGPWHQRRGYDSLLQSASGFNLAEAQSKGTDMPTALPMQVLDYASGFLMAFGTQVALLRQLTEGGSFHVEVSLARTGLWLRSLGQNSDWLNCPAPDEKKYLESYPSHYGDLRALPHTPIFSVSSSSWKLKSAPPGTHEPEWPQLK